MKLNEIVARVVARVVGATQELASCKEAVNQMKVHTRLVETSQIKTESYSRLAEASQTEYASLQNKVTQYACTVDICRAENITLNNTLQEFRAELETRGRQIFALESQLNSFTQHASAVVAALRHLDTVKREAPGTHALKPAMLQ